MKFLCLVSFLTSKVLADTSFANDHFTECWDGKICRLGPPGSIEVCNQDHTGCYWIYDEEPTQVEDVQSQQEDQSWIDMINQNADDDKKYAQDQFDKDKAIVNTQYSKAETEYQKDKKILDKANKEYSDDKTWVESEYAKDKNWLGTQLAKPGQQVDKEISKDKDYVNSAIEKEQQWQNEEKKAFDEDEAIVEREAPAFFWTLGKILGILMLSIIGLCCVILVIGNLTTCCCFKKYKSQYEKKRKLKEQTELGSARKLNDCESEVRAAEIEVLGGTEKSDNSSDEETPNPDTELGDKVDVNDIDISLGKYNSGNFSSNQILENSQNNLIEQIKHAKQDSNGLEMSKNNLLTEIKEANDVFKLE